MKSSLTEKFVHNLRNRFRSNGQIEKWHELLCITGILLCIIFGTLPVTAQPSGGPYGPIRQTYDLPKVAGKIFYVAPDGQAKESGESLGQPTTLEVAIERVKTGDAIIMRGGTYRTGNLILNQGIIIQPYADEQPVVKGTLVATEWKNLGNGLWTTSWSRLFPSKPDYWWYRPGFGIKTPLCLFNNDMVFLDGKLLRTVSWEGEVDENSYYIDYDAKLVYIGSDPTKRIVEITAFDTALFRTTGICHGKTSDRKGPVIRGITFTQYACRAVEIEGTEPAGLSDESKYGKEVVGTTLEHCTISFCSRTAAYFKGDKLTLRHCKISDTSTEGIYVTSSSDVLLEKNIFTRNNIEKITGYYPAAVKIFNQCHRVTCRDNLIIDLPYSTGVWFDVGNLDCCFINNWVEGVGNVDRELVNYSLWPNNGGFLYEISKGAICAGNVFINCDLGIFVINSSNVQMYQNTLVNSTVCIGSDERSPANDPSFSWHSGAGPDVDKRDGHIFVNNLLTGNKNYHRPLLFVWQSDSVCKQLQKPQFKQLDYNMYVRSQDKVNKSLIWWSPATNKYCRRTFGSPEDLHKLYPEYSANSLYFDYDRVPLFKSSELGNYQLLQAFPGSKAKFQLPDEISKLLGIPKKDIRYIGAYPILP